MQIQNLYPAIQFPVTIETPMIAPLIRWEHSQSWFVATFNHLTHAKVEHIFRINLNEDEFQNIIGHKIDGRILFPATSYLLLAWKSFAMMMGMSKEDLCVEFRDVKFLRATTVSNETEVTLSVVIHRGTGQFEVRNKIYFEGSGGNVFFWG